jgi:hypothetical protein
MPAPLNPQLDQMLTGIAALAAAGRPQPQPQANPGIAHTGSGPPHCRAWRLREPEQSDHDRHLRGRQFRRRHLDCPQ